MKLTFNKKQCFTVPEKLYQILSDELVNVLTPEIDVEVIILNFRDPDYSSHPLEIRLVKSMASVEAVYEFAYITDFSLQGSPYPELVVDIDVCFIAEQVYTVYGGWLDKTSGEELKELFLTNFISYVEMQVFEVEVTFYWPFYRQEIFKLNFIGNNHSHYAKQLKVWWLSHCQNI